MTRLNRHTYIAHGRLAAQELRLGAARAHRHGVQVHSFEQVVARLAGGFNQPINADALRSALQIALPATDLGELNSIKLLPGMVSAAADTLHKVWRTGIDLAARSDADPRIAALAALEGAVLEILPSAMRRPADLASIANARMEYASTLFGEIDIVGISELSPCWRPLLGKLSDTVPVRWLAGPRSVPEWLEGLNVIIVRSEALGPQVTVVSAASRNHEVIEAIRWARDLLVTGKAEASQIAIAAAAPAAYDDEFMALRADSNIEIHFEHGVRVVTTREGQTAAALADTLVRGVSPGRLRRLAVLIGDHGPFGKLPEGWQRLLPRDVTISSSAGWDRFLERLTAGDWPGEVDHTPTLRLIIQHMIKGVEDAEEAGRIFLPPGALRIWNKALLAGSAAALDVTIDNLRQDDTSEACASVLFAPASALAASPRRFVRLLGLTSAEWPRRISEDRLLSDHIVPLDELDPLPVAAADRRDFETIMRTTASQVVLSRSRRDGDGRLLGKSPLLRDYPPADYLRRNRKPFQAMSETDRILARPNDFKATNLGHSAFRCWSNWQRPVLTPHDGLVRADHPALLAAIGRVQSANSLSKLLRSPLTFAWTYALGVRAPDTPDDALILDARQAGLLLHDILDQTVQQLESSGSFASASAQDLADAVEAAATQVSSDWQARQSIPPAVIWRRSLEDAKLLALEALQFSTEKLDGQKSYTEVPFGGQVSKNGGVLPWDPAQAVEIAGTGFQVSGFIDRLDLSSDAKTARVFDYKSGKMPREIVVLQGGKELQRCLYAFAVKSLLGDNVKIEAALLYPRHNEARYLDEPETVLADLGGHLRAARTNLAAGRALIGPDSGGDRDDLSFALPAYASSGYCQRKLDAVIDLLGDAALVWEAT